MTSTRWLLILIGTLLLSHGAHADEPAAPAIRIVNCDEKVQSHKRGLCANRLSAADMQALSPGVSWYYNWAPATKDTPPATGALEYIPMVWGGQPSQLTDLQTHLATLQKMPRAILFANEPNLRTQASLTPRGTAALYRKTKTIADVYHVPVIGPNMALGASDFFMIKDMDPIQHHPVAYKTMEPYLKAYFFFMDRPQDPILGVHSYGPAAELVWAIETFSHEYQRPVWVTEYSQLNAIDSKKVRDYLIETTDYMERSPNVTAYAWFKERGKEPNLSLLAPESGKLTPLGQTYVALPVHDSHLYYRLPGQLPAANYVAMSNLELKLNPGSNNTFFVLSLGDESWVDYNLQIDKPGKYQLDLQVAGVQDKIDILEGDYVLGSISTSRSDWHTETATLELTQGSHTIRVRLGKIGQALGWLDFKLN